MDNLKYYSDNLAHDFDMFMPKPKAEPQKTTKQNAFKRKEKIIPMPKEKVQKSESKKTSVKGKVFAISMAAFIVIAFFTNIFLRAEISMVGSELGAAESIGAKLKSEETRLSVELEKKTSVGNLEKQAEKLGMQKPDKTQIHYIFNYDEEPQVETADVQ